MNRTHIGRIIWKDYQRLCGFWFALLVFWLIGLALAAMGSLVFHESYTFDNLIGGVCLTTVFYGLGCGGLAFAMEHEEGTYVLLRSLPMTARNLFHGKWIFAALSTLALGAALLLVCLIFGLLLESLAPGDFRPIDWRGNSFNPMTLIFLIPLAILVGMFWSMRVDRPYLAIGLAGMTMAIVIYASAALIAILFFSGNTPPEDIFENVWPVYLVTSVVLWYLDRSLAGIWLGQETVGRKVRRAAAVVAPVVGTAVANSAPMQQAEPTKRLLWLHWKQSWKYSMVLGALGVLFAAASVPTHAVAISLYEQQFAPTIAVLIVALLGVSVFRHEHEQQRYRLLGQFNAPPFSYWASRQILPGMIVLVIAVLIGCCFSRMVDLATRTTPQTRLMEFHAFCIGISGVLATFGIAQLCSIACRSLILAIACAIFLTALLWGWTSVCFDFDIPAIVGVVPFFVMTMVASYLRVPRWFQGVNSWRQWVVPVIPLLLLIGVAPAAALYRAYQYGPVSLGFITDGNRKEWLYGDLGMRLESTEEITPIIHEALAIAGEDDNFAEAAEWMLAEIEDLDDFVIQSQPSSKLRSIAWNLDEAAVAALAKDEPEQAWRYWQSILRLGRARNDGVTGLEGCKAAYELERMVYARLAGWAMHAGNSAERVTEIALWLEEYRKNEPKWPGLLKAEYAEVTRLIELAEKGGRNHKPIWEIHRARRLRDHQLRRKYYELLAMQDGPYQIPTYATHPSPLPDSNLLEPMSMPSWEFALVAAKMEHERRGMICQLATIAYHQRNGRYPASLDRVTLGEKPLPNCMAWTDQSMSLMREPETGSLWITGIVGDGHTESWWSPRLKSFLLPDFENWDVAEYYSRSLAGPQALPAIGRQDTGSPAVLARSYDRESVTVLRQEWESLSAVLDEHTQKQAIDAMINQVLRGEPKAQLAAIQQLAANPEISIAPFVAALADCSTETNLRVGSRARNLILDRLATGQLQPESLAQHVEISTDGQAEGVVGMPAKNPENGHYYESITLPHALGWLAAEKAASRRRFRGVQGYLATITSASENEFVSQAFAREPNDSLDYDEGSFESIETGQVAGLFLSALKPSWIGASDAEEKGNWKWVSGPEQGQTFFNATTADSAGTDAGFHNWLDSQRHPTDSQGQWLAMLPNWNEQDERDPEISGRWIGLNEMGFAAVRSYIVEYSFEEDTKPTAEE